MRTFLLILATLALASCATARGKAERAMAKLSVDMSKEEVGAILGSPVWSSHAGIDRFTWKYEFRDDAAMWDRYEDSPHYEAGQPAAKTRGAGHRWLTLDFEEGRLVRWTSSR